MLGLPNQVKYARTCASSIIVKYKSRIYLPESNRNGPRCCLQLPENVSRTAAVLLCEWFWQLQHNNVVSGCVQTDKAHRQHLFACVLPRKFSDAVGQTRATIPLEAFSRCRIVITRHHTHTLGYTWPYPYSTYLHSHTHTHTHERRCQTKTAECARTIRFAVAPNRSVLVVVVAQSVAARWCLLLLLWLCLGVMVVKVAVVWCVRICGRNSHGIRNTKCKHVFCKQNCCTTSMQSATHEIANSRQKNMQISTQRQRNEQHVTERANNYCECGYSRVTHAHTKYSNALVIW